MKKILLIVMIILTLFVSCNKKKDYDKVTVEEVEKELAEVRAKVDKEKNPEKLAKLATKETALTALILAKEEVAQGIRPKPERMRVVYKTEEEVNRMNLDEINKEAETLNSKLWYEGEYTDKDIEYSYLLQKRYRAAYQEKNKN